MPILHVPPEAAGSRLDAWLSRSDAQTSRAGWQRLVRQGAVTVDGKVLKPSHTLVGGETVEYTIPEPEPAEPEPEPIPLDILYEDADLVAVNKPPGLVVHPAPGHASGTLVNALLHHCQDLSGVGGELRPGIVHRLDRDTSGVIVAAKHDAALQGLQRQFKNRTVRKVYLAIVTGCPDPSAGRIETLIGRSDHDRKRMSASPSRGRRAVTLYKTEEQLPDAALLRVRIETGRTHQIRVHLAHLGHPVIGDRQYGGRRAAQAEDQAARQLLHAHVLALRHPASGEELEFIAPMPEDMLAFLGRSRRRTGE